MQLKFRVYNAEKVKWSIYSVVKLTNCRYKNIFNGVKLSEWVYIVE